MAKSDVTVTDLYAYEAGLETPYLPAEPPAEWIKAMANGVMASRDVIARVDPTHPGVASDMTAAYHALRRALLDQQEDSSDE